MLSQFFLLIKSLPRNDPLSDSAFPSFHQLSFGIKISYPKAPESPLEVVLFSMLVKSPLSNQHHKSGTHGAYPNVSTLTLTKWQFQALFGHRHCCSGILAGKINIANQPSFFKCRKHIFLISVRQDQWLLGKLS